MCFWDRWLWELGFAVCHQRPERLLYFGGRPLFVCARDTGLFVSFFTVLLVLSLARSKQRAGMPPLPVLVLCGAGILFLAWDGLTSYLGLRESGNVIRFLSGFAAGTGLAFPVAAWFNRTVFGGDRELKVGSRPVDWLAVGVAGGMAIALYLSRPEALFRLGQLWLCVCLLGTFWVLNLLLVTLLMRREGEGISPARAAAAVLLTAAELCGSYFLHRSLAGKGPEIPLPGRAKRSMCSILY